MTITSSAFVDNAVACGCVRGRGGIGQAYTSHCLITYSAERGQPEHALAGWNDEWASRETDLALLNPLRLQSPAGLEEKMDQHCQPGEEFNFDVTNVKCCCQVKDSGVCVVGGSGGSRLLGLARPPDGGLQCPAHGCRCRAACSRPAASPTHLQPGRRTTPLPRARLDGIAALL